MKFLLPVFLLFTLSGCYDAGKNLTPKMVTGCTAAIKHLSKQGEEITVQKSNVILEKGASGEDLQRVTLDAHYVRDGGMIEAKTYVCRFKMIKFGKVAEFYNLEKDGEQIGQFESGVMGDPIDLVNVTNVSEEALR